MATQKYTQQDYQDILTLREVYEGSLVEFTRRAIGVLEPNTRYHHNWHVDAICDHLEACYDRKIKRLIINMPPRSMKSNTVTVAFPAWAMGKNPYIRIVTASFAQHLSSKHSQDTRFLMQSPFYKSIFPKTIIAKDQNEKQKFMTTVRGQRMAVSVGSGGATGDGGDIIILDDPLNPEQAASDLERESANNWHQQTWSSRLNNPAEGVMILVMQRLHEKDVTGLLLAEDGWTHLNLPAINDVARTISIGKPNGKAAAKEWEVGELLHPERLSHEVLEQKRRGMSAFQFAGQYLQRPVPEGGGIIKEHHWQLWEGAEMPETSDIIQVYDTAYTEKTQNDYCARTTWGIFQSEEGEDNILLLEMMQERMEFPELRRSAKESYRRFTKKDGTVPLVLIEEKAAGMPLIQEMRLAGMRVKGIKRNANSGDKVSRAHNVTHIFESGRVWVPSNGIEVDGQVIYKPKTYAQAVIDECMAFPFGAHDDIVDTVVDAVAWMRRRHEINADEDKEDDVDFSPSSSKRRRFYS
jgi:predicted phage terminase large subunit-like protein